MIVASRRRATGDGPRRSTRIARRPLRSCARCCRRGCTRTGGGVGRSLGSRCGLACGLEVELRHVRGGDARACRRGPVRWRPWSRVRSTVNGRRRHGRRQSSEVDAGSSGPPATRGPGVHPGGSRPLTITTPILAVRSPKAAPSPTSATPTCSSAPRMAFAWAGLRASPDSKPLHRHPPDPRRCGLTRPVSNQGGLGHPCSGRDGIPPRRPFSSSNPRRGPCQAPRSGTYCSHTSKKDRNYGGVFVSSATRR